MPEGDTVHAAARRVDSALAGVTLERAELRVPRFAGVDLRGRVVERARARGKHLLIDVGPDAEGRDPVTLHVHLKMEGRIHVHRRGERWRFPGHTARLVLAGDGVEVVGTELGLLRALSPREADVLTLAAEGSPVEEIARRAHLSAGTVRNYLSAAVSKLGVTNRHEAARAARDRGWI